MCPDGLRIISAGHSLNVKDYERLMIPLHGEREALFLCFLGDLATTGIEGNVENNPIDFAEVKILKKDRIKQLLKYHDPIRISEVDFCHNPIDGDARYLVFGHPTSKSKFDYKTHKKFDSVPLKLITSPITDKNLYQKYGYSKKEHVLLKIQKNITEGKDRLILPKTKGLSGCGVYFLPNLNKSEPSGAFKLVGILTEVDFKRRFAVVVRISTIYGEKSPLTF